MESDIKNNKNQKEKNSDYVPPFVQEFRSRKANIIWHYVDRLASSISFIAKIYEKKVGEAYRKEREKFNLSDSKHILHIGCGSYPITAFVLAEIDNVKIVTIDLKHNSIKLANKLIHKRKLDKKIQAKYGDGTNYPLDAFDTIIVSGCSIPKINVLKHVIKNSKPKTRIIIRDSYFDIEAIANLTNSHKKIELIEKMENKPFPTSKWDSFYIVKK